MSGYGAVRLENEALLSAHEADQRSRGRLLQLQAMSSRLFKSGAMCLEVCGMPSVPGEVEGLASFLGSSRDVGAPVLRRSPTWSSGWNLRTSASIQVKEAK